MNLYRIPKRRVGVEVALEGCAAQRVDVFLAEGAESHLGRERPSDLLNRKDPFLAVSESEEDVVVLARNAIAFVVVATDLEHDAEELASGADETVIALHIDLDDGRSLEGVARYLLPDSARRLQDLLNQQEPFLRIDRDGDSVLVNKDRIVRVRERGSERS